MDGKTKLNDFLDEWLETVMHGNVRYATWAAYGGYINNHIKRLIGDVPLDELTPPLLQKFIHDLTEEGRIGARTIGIVVTTLKSTLLYAEDCDYIMKSPCRRLKLPRVEEEEVVVFANDEQTRIERAVANSDDKRHIGILLTLYTGVRIGELCALKWENVDFNERVIYVKASLSRTATDKGSKRKTEMKPQEPKTKKSKRSIHLPNFLVKILRELKKTSDSEYVFSGPTGKFVHPRTMQVLYKKLLASIGIRYIKFHGLRHTFATRAIETNADVKTISVTLGHTNAMITINRYTHSLIEQKRKMTFGLNAYFENKKIAVFT
jgi:integrase